MIWPGCEHLKLGKSSAFVKRDLRQLPLTGAEFEADFFLDRRFSTARREVWEGMVIERECGALLAMEQAEWPPPTVNDLATLLAHAMCRPWTEGDRQRPRTTYLRDRPQWQELLPHLRQLGIEVVLGDDLPRLDEAVIEWMREKSARHVLRRPLPIAKIKEDLKNPFPARKRTSADVPIALMLWTDEILKAGYPSARKGTPAAYDPTITVAIALTVEQWQAVLTETDMARTKKLRPRLEAMAATEQTVALSVDDWGSIMLALCGGTAHSGSRVRKYLLTIAGRIAASLSEALRIDGPPWVDGDWNDE